MFFFKTKRHIDTGSSVVTSATILYPVQGLFTILIKPEDSADAGVTIRGTYPQNGYKVVVEKRMSGYVPYDCAAENTTRRSDLTGSQSTQN